MRSSLQGDARLSQQMNVEERLVADYAGTGLTVGKRPMHYRRPELRRAISSPPKNYAHAATVSLFERQAASLPGRYQARPGSVLIRLLCIVNFVSLGSDFGYSDCRR
jgi:hypothetical protein